MATTDDDSAPLILDQAGQALSPAAKAALTQAKWHLLGLVGVVVLFASADAWVASSDLGIARVFAGIAAIVAAYGLAQLLHEWGHYLGARLSGARAPLKPTPALLAYDFDFQSNSPEQFLWMSVSGSIGNLLTIVLVWQSIPLDATHRIILLASTVGVAVFVAVLEWPVIAHAYKHRDPLAALSHGFAEGLPVFRRAIIVGIGVGIASYFVIA